MVLFKKLFFSRLPKPLVKPYHSPIKSTIDLYYSTLLQPIPNQNTINYNKNHFNHPNSVNFTKKIHFHPSLSSQQDTQSSNLTNTHIKFNSSNENPDANSTEITIQSERICRILSNIRDSKTVDSALASASVKISSNLVEQVLRKLSNAGLLGLSFFRWAEKQKGFKPTSDSYNALVEALGKIKQFKMVWLLINEMKKNGLLTKESFALVSRRYARARKVNEAIVAFERMEKYGWKPELSDFNRLIDTLCKSRNVERAQQLFDKWKNNKFKPDIKSYTILLEGWGNEHNLLRLDEVYREMRANGFEPDVVSYGILINAYCKSKKYDKAIEMYREMERENIKATPHVYCTLINGLGSERRLDEALEFFELAKGSGFPLEAPTYNAVVGAYCWSVRMHDVYRIVEEMRKCGVGPNARTYDIILHHLVKIGRRKEAFSVFQEMSDESGCEPTVSTYEIMVRMFCNEDRTDMAVRVWNQMKAKGVLPGMHMFSTLINSLCHENKVDDACKYFQEMLDMGIRPPNLMFNSLKQALLDEGKNDLVLNLTQKVERLRKVQVTR